MNKVTKQIALNGNRYAVTGRYVPRYEASPWQPAEPARFEIHRVVALNGGNVLFDSEQSAEIEQLCIRQHEEDLAYALAGHEERRIAELKEKAA